MAGELSHVRNMTLRHGGLVSFKFGGYTSGEEANSAIFHFVRIQDYSTFKAERIFTVETGFNMTVDYILIEGGGNLQATNLSLQVKNLSIDDGGSLHADGLGYKPNTPQNNITNIGLGKTAVLGSSGGGHGGSSGRGKGTDLTGMPYGDFFEPVTIGSAGGGGLNVGGSGGGLLTVFVLDTLWLDGEIRADGQPAINPTGGGGSGGTVRIIAKKIKGFGNITANGGDQFASGTGGGGSGGRIALNFWVNETYLGKFQAHGGFSNWSLQNSGEPGGPGPVFMFHEGEVHKTLFVENNFLQSKSVGKVRDFADLTDDHFKAWIIEQDTDNKYLDGNNRSTTFDELQIYSNAHLVILPRDPQAGVFLHFQHMIGDRSGVLHVGPRQAMDLKRPAIDIPFSTYIYPSAYLGLAPDTSLNQVFVQVGQLGQGLCFVCFSKFFQ